MYFQVIGQFKKQLGQLDKWLETATKYAEQKKFDPQVWLTTRLAPDQFAFARQVQVVCDTAKLGASRVGGKEAPKHDDSEKTIEELRVRIKSTIDFLNAFTAADFEQAAKREITQPRWEGKKMTGANYFVEHVVPNFYFHLTTVYALLRSNGVDIGKRDYLGQLTFEAS
jgi:uncharacterized protein